MVRKNSANAAIGNPRELAVRLLMEAADQKLLVPQAALRIPFHLKPADRQLCFEMVYGTLRYLPGLERVLRGFCPKPKYPEQIRWLLLISLYQMGFMRIPDYASVNEALGVVRNLKMPGLRGLVNGVLRNAGRKGRSLWPDSPGPDWLLPDWIWERFCGQYGEAEVSSWLEDWAQRPQTAYWSIEDRAMEGDAPVPGLPHGFRQGGSKADALIAGGCYVQNESSQAISELVCRLEPKSVLDLCAAPGGKVCYIAKFGAAERLLACDISEDRLNTLKQNRERLGLEFEIQLADGTLSEDETLFDLVMVDAPCSGLGIIGRHPEIKLHKTGPAPDHLLDLQAQLMAGGYARLKPGGYLLFTVCSLDKAEVPAAPEGALFQKSLLENKFPASFAKVGDDRFYIQPTSARDGFQGVLYQKPA